MLKNNCHDKIVVLLFFILVQCSYGLKVAFRENCNAHIEPFNSQIQKREMSSFLDEASFSFNGVKKIASVPVLFPTDICILDLQSGKYAASLHMNRNMTRHFAVYKMNNGSYIQLADIPASSALSMDCAELGEKGYVAIALNITSLLKKARDGSPIFEIANDNVRAVQYFSTQNLRSFYLRASGNDLYLLQTLQNTKATPNLFCPYFKWTGSTFHKLGRIPCSNAKRLEPFSIDYENYVAVANYADQQGRTKTFSEIYKFDREKQRFQLSQKIKTNGAVDVKYFSVPVDEVIRKHFLIFGNSINNKINSKDSSRGDALEADSIFYVFDKGQFIPYQRLSLYAVEKFLPVQNMNAEKFLLLVACADQDTKIYNFNDWTFEESKVQFTAGAFGKGVSEMRIHEENDNSYLVIANELMMENETNIFLPIFQQEEGASALKQQIIEWAQVNIERLSKIDVEKLKNDVEAKLAKIKPPQFPTTIPESNIKTVITKSLTYEPLGVSQNYWNALKYANKAVDVLESQLKSRNLHKREVKDEEEYDYEELNVGTLIVEKELNAKWVNGIEVENPKFESITAKKVVVKNHIEEPKLNFNNESEIDELIVDNLQISGKLNEYTWREFTEDTLKRVGDQTIEAPVKVDILTADAVEVENNVISGQNLETAVLIDKGNFKIEQDVHFLGLLTAKDVIIKERLNHIKVINGKLDVLLKNSNETQVVEGWKEFENIEILEPIVVAGRMIGRHFDEIAPSKVVHEDVFLNGDYVIDGDVTITKLLTTKDLIDFNTNKSLKETLRNGIAVNKIVENVNLKFEQPLIVNNSIVSFINGHDLQHLVRINTSEVQVVTGEKTFKQNLEVREGFAEAKLINGINVEELEKNLLMKNTNQTVRVPMHFGRVIAKSINATNIKLNNQNLTDYLTKSTIQHINGTLQLKNLTADNAYIENMIVDEEVLNEIRSSTQYSFENNTKFMGTIYAKNLFSNSSINGMKVQDFLKAIENLDADIVYKGNLQFNYDMNITNLTFYGSFNGIPAADFGHCWLQKTGDQEFTAAQTFASINAADGIQLDGRLNGYYINDFFTRTLWINRDEYISRAVFHSPIEIEGTLYTNTLNGIRVPDDLLLRNSPYTQTFYDEVVVEKDVHVTGAILNTTTINDINLHDLDRFLNEDTAEKTFIVEHANFAYTPSFMTLNGHDLKKTLDEVWLANENTEILQPVEIEEINVEGLLEFEGLLNNMDLHYLKENYFSLSRAQIISNEHCFEADTVFEGDVYVDDVQLFGPIIDRESKKEFDFNEFTVKALKKNGPYNFTGKWKFNEVHIEGDLEDVIINDLDFSKDVLLNNKPGITEIIGKKRILGSATIQKLYATESSTVNNVPVASWIRDSVFVYENYTIRGVTTIDSLNVYNNLIVHGKVNNISFDDQTLLLRDRDQIIDGDLILHNKNVEEQKIMTSTIQNLYTEDINGESVDKFFANHSKLSIMEPNESYLIVAPKIERQYNDSIRKRDAQKRSASYKLKIIQTIFINSSKLVTFSMHLKENIVDVLAILDEHNNNLKFYVWNSDQRRFMEHKDFNLKLNNNISTKELDTYLSALGIGFREEDLKLLPLMEQLKSNKIIGIQIGMDSCIVTYGEEGAENIMIYCKKNLEGMQTLSLYKKLPGTGVKQVLDVGNSTLAILFEKAIEIWSALDNPTLNQYIPIIQGEQIATTIVNTTTYISVVAGSPRSVYILSSTNSKAFELLQILNCTEPLRASFFRSPNNDIFLEVTTNHKENLVIYQYVEGYGFQRSIVLKNLPINHHVRMVQLEAANEALIALQSEKRILFMELIKKL